MIMLHILHDVQLCSVFSEQSHWAICRRSGEHAAQ
jgi:hypothetical protein